MIKNILLLEDDKEAAQLLIRLISQEIPDLNILYASSYNEALGLTDKYIMNLLLLDVDLGESEKTGIDFAEAFRKLPNNTYIWIVFLSAHTDYITQAMNRSHCYDYLVKPINMSELLSLIKKLLKCHIVDETYPSFLCIKQKNITLKIPTEDIVYIETLNKNCIIHFTSRTHEISRYPLKNIISQLPPNDFIQCHKSFIINTRKSDGIFRSANNSYVIMPGMKEQIPIGDAYRENIMQMLYKNNF